MASQVYWVTLTDPQFIRTKPDIILQPSDLIPDWVSAIFYKYQYHNVSI